MILQNSCLKSTYNVVHTSISWFLTTVHGFFQQHQPLRHPFKTWGVRFQQHLLDTRLDQMRIRWGRSENLRSPATHGDGWTPTTTIWNGGDEQWWTHPSYLVVNRRIRGFWPHTPMFFGRVSWGVHMKRSWWWHGLGPKATMSEDGHRDVCHTRWSAGR